MQEERYLIIQKNLELVLRKKAQEEPELSISDAETNLELEPVTGPDPELVRPAEPITHPYEVKLDSDGFYFFPNIDSLPPVPAYGHHSRNDEARIMKLTNKKNHDDASRVFGSTYYADINEGVARALFKNLIKLQPILVIELTKAKREDFYFKYMDLINAAFAESIKTRQLYNVFYIANKNIRFQLYEANEDPVNEIIKNLPSYRVMGLFFGSGGWGGVPPMMQTVWEQIVGGKFPELKEILKEKIDFGNLDRREILRSKMYEVYPGLVSEKLFPKDGNPSDRTLSSRFLLRIIPFIPEAKKYLLNTDVKLEELFKDGIDLLKSFTEEERMKIYASLLHKEHDGTASNFFHALYFSKDDALEFVIKEIPQSILDRLAERSSEYLVTLGHENASLLSEIEATGRRISESIEKNIYTNYMMSASIESTNMPQVKALVERYGIDSSMVVDKILEESGRAAKIKPDSFAGGLITKAVDGLITDEAEQRGDRLMVVLRNFKNFSKLVTPNRETFLGITNYAKGYFPKTEEYTKVSLESLYINEKAEFLGSMNSMLIRSDKRFLDEEAVASYLDLAEDLFSAEYIPEKNTNATQSYFKSSFENDTIGVRKQHLRDIKETRLLAKAGTLGDDTIRRYIELLLKINSNTLFEIGRSGDRAFKSQSEYLNYIRRILGEDAWNDIISKEENAEKIFSTSITPSVPLISEFPEYFDIALKNLNFESISLKYFIYSMLGKVFPKILRGDLSDVSDENFEFINNNFINNVRSGDIEDYIKLQRSVRGFGRARTWFDRDPDFLGRMLERISDSFPDAYITFLDNEDLNVRNKKYIRKAFSGANVNTFLSIVESFGNTSLVRFEDKIAPDYPDDTWNPDLGYQFVDSDRGYVDEVTNDLDISGYIKNGNEDILLIASKTLLKTRDVRYLVNFLDKASLWEFLKGRQDLLNEVMQMAQSMASRSLRQNMNSHLKLQELMLKAEIYYDANFLREVDDIDQAKKIYSNLKNDIEVESLSDNIKVTESIYQTEQRGEYFEDISKRYTISNNNVDPTKILYDVGKDLIHAGDGVDHTNVGASGFTNSWALASIGKINSEDIVGADDEGKERSQRRTRLYDEDEVVPKKDTPIVVIEQYQSDYPPLYSLIFDEKYNLKETLIKDYGIDSFKDFTKHLDYINKAYPYLAIINTIEVAKKLGAKNIYIHEYDRVVELANIKNVEKVKKLYDTIPSLIATRRVVYNGYEPLWEVPVDDSVILKMHEEIKKITGKGPEYDFSKTPKQNAEVAKALRDKLRIDMRTKWNVAEENIAKLESVKDELIAQLEVDMKDFDPAEIEALSTPTEVLIYLGRVKAQYSKGAFKKKFNQINRSLGILSRAAEAFVRMIKISTMLVLSKNNRMKNLNKIWRKSFK